MADRAMYPDGHGGYITEEEARERAAHTREGDFGGGIDDSDSNPEMDGGEGYRDSMGRGYGYGGRAAHDDSSGGSWRDGYGGSGGSYGAGGATGSDPNTWNDWSSGVPIVSWLLGQDADEANVRADRERRDRLGIASGLSEWMPSADDLAVNYEDEDYVGDRGAAGLTEGGRTARNHLAEWAEGGFTDADRAMMDAERRRSGMGARADREATLSAASARGMGGSGATLASMLGAGEAAADRSAGTEASMMGAAQQRQYQAVEAMNANDATDRGRTDDWTRYEADYERGLEGRNTGYHHDTAESRSRARGDAYQNLEDQAAMALGQYGDTRRPDDTSDEDAAGFIGGLLDEL